MMSKIMITLVTLLMCAGLLFSTVAEAKRFGGGGSAGRSYSIGHSSGTTAKPAAPAAAGNRSSWLGPLAGLAAGGLLASLFMGHGLGGFLGSLLLVLLGLFAIVFLLRLFRSHAAKPQYNFSQQPANYGPKLSPSEAAQQTPNYGGATSDNLNYPADFDAPAFIRGAKILFVRLQASNDNKNLADIHEFTTPAMFAEVSMQMQERGDAKNFTEVVRLDAELLQVFQEQGETIASVRFTGLIREAENAPAEAFSEVWHFQQDGTSWRVAGIEQSVV